MNIVIMTTTCDLTYGLASWSSTFEAGNSLIKSEPGHGLIFQLYACGRISQVSISEPWNSLSDILLWHRPFSHQRAILIHRISMRIFTCDPTLHNCISISCHHSFPVASYGVSHVAAIPIHKLEGFPEIMSIQNTVIRSFSSN